MAHQDDCLGQLVKVGAISGAAGVFISAIQNALDTHREGARGVITRTGGTIGYFAAIGGIFAATECATRNIRGKEDMWNSAAGGCAAGIVAGIRAHSFSVMCGACAAIGGTMAAFEYGGGNIKGLMANMTAEEKRKWRESFFKKNQEEEAAVFDTEGFDIVFKEQYLDLSTRLPKQANIYGLIARKGHEGEAGTITTIYARDAAVPRDENLYGAHPIYMEIRDGKAHGVLFLNSNGMDVHLNPERLTFTPNGGIIDLYVFLGPTPQDVLRQYLELVGKPVMPQLWTLGTHQCRWGYSDLDKVKAVVNGYRNAEIPLEAMWIDIDYMDRFKDFSLDEIAFPPQQLKAYIDQLHQNNQHIVMIIDPGIKVEEGYRAYDEGIKRGVFCRLRKKVSDGQGGEVEKDDVYIGRVWPGKTAFPDWFNPQTGAYWSEMIGDFLTQCPIDGIWIDMNEFSNFGDGDVSYLTDKEAEAMIPTADQTVEDMVEGVTADNKKHELEDEETEGLKSSKHRKTDEIDVAETKTKTGIDEEKEGIVYSVHNPPYRINHAGTHEPLDARSGAPDAYHHGGAIEYDVHNLYGHMECKSTFEALKSHFGEKHKPYVLTRSSFIGTGQWAGKWTGDNWSTWESLAESIPSMLSMQLFGIPYIGADVGGFNRNTAEELMIRWTELAAFYPFLRNHNGLNNIPQEPYQWNSVTVVAKKYYRLRYQLLPYWYTLFWKSAMKGDAVLQSMAFTFPGDKKALDNERQYLLGAALLISPVLKPGQTKVKAYLPTSEKWYEFPSGKPVNRGGIVTLDAPMDTLPLHMRGGTIIPMYTKSGLTIHETKHGSSIILVVAVDADGHAQGELYSDDDTALPAENSWYGQFNLTSSTLTANIQEKGSESVVLSQIMIFGAPSQFKRYRVDEGEWQQGQWVDNAFILHVNLKASFQVALDA
ncbi:hypothetical protein BZG36_00010 [Bifiguratus adelaidae]|uniref:Maltase n=1 Tax=Bifiguratus adelaidae TaxID=1938954 RepID=A0A261Y8S8_9FUNG|nr:hypothetical protein BZG36_00010 [Bifiguratus adelaidae]